MGETELSTLLRTFEKNISYKIDSVFWCKAKKTCSANKVLLWLAKF